MTTPIERSAFRSSVALQMTCPFTHKVLDHATARTVTVTLPDDSVGRVFAHPTVTVDMVSEALASSGHKAKRITVLR